MDKYIVEVDSNKDKLKMLTELIVEIENDKLNLTTKWFFELSTKEKFDYIEAIESKGRELDLLNKKIDELMQIIVASSGKLYLTEIIASEKPKFNSNNLILAPVGSGKTTLITEHLIENIDQTVLLLVSNTGLKDDLAPNNNELRGIKRNRMFTSQNKFTCGDKLYKIQVMTYAEFGERIFINDNFIKKHNISQIFCDEIHSLPEYIKYGIGSGSLLHAQRYLFTSHKDVQIFYFTATGDNLFEAEHRRNGLLANVEIFNYLEHPNIRKYITRITREINHLDQIRHYLRERKPSFDYFNYKGIIFSKTITSLKRAEQILLEEGFKPLVLWSNNNKDYKLTDEQVRARNELLSSNKIPEPYNFLLYNSSLQEGWDLKDDLVELAIMNTTNKTELTQALGRLRKNIDFLICRANNVSVELEIPTIPEQYLNVYLTPEEKEDLASELKIMGNQGENIAWRTLKQMLIKSNRYNVDETQKFINNKRRRVAIITKKEEEI